MSAPPVCWIVRNAAVGGLLLYETALCLDNYAWQLPSMAAMTGQRHRSSALREACRPKSRAHACMVQSTTFTAVRTACRPVWHWADCSHALGCMSAPNCFLFAQTIACGFQRWNLGYFSLLWLSQEHLPTLYASQQALPRATGAAGVQHVRHDLQRGKVDASTEVPALSGEHNLRNGIAGS